MQDDEGSLSAKTAILILSVSKASFRKLSDSDSDLSVKFFYRKYSCPSIIFSSIILCSPRVTFGSGWFVARAFLESVFSEILIGQAMSQVGRWAPTVRALF